MELTPRDRAILAGALAAAMRRHARRQRERVPGIRAQDAARRSAARRLWASAGFGRRGHG